MKEPKFEIGDQVRVVNYGHYIFDIVGESFRKIDINPEVVGKVGVVIDISNDAQYALKGIPKKHCWYSEDQLELIK